MTKFVSKLATEIRESKRYQEAEQSLFENYISKLSGSEVSIEQGIIKKLLFAVQVFLKSEDIEDQMDAKLLLAMLLDTNTEKKSGIAPIAYSIFGNSGDFPNMELIKKRYEVMDYRYGLVEQASMNYKKKINTVDELGMTLTDYQRSLWRELTKDKDIITSAPTSAGKTHIVISYLIEKVAESAEGSFAAIIVPTRALISEVASKVHEGIKKKNTNKNIGVYTVPKSGDYEEKSIFVMTQERLHEVMLRGDIGFDYLLIDEAHNITDESRGVLLHMIIEKLLESSTPQVIISMPSSKYQNSFSSIFRGIDFKKEITDKSPVTKVLLNVTPKGRDLIVSAKGLGYETRISKNFNGTDLSDIVYRLGKDQTNIIFQNRTDYCEKVATKIAGKITEIDQSSTLEEAADYVKKVIHKDFTLVDNLKKGVAFHYGPLPSSVRVMVESLAKENHIKYIVCTSTLAEGVNLPAKNLFLKNPQRQIAGEPSQKLDEVTINNITGRAGRMLKHFSGNVILVEPDSWSFKDYFEKEVEAEKIPTYYKVLNEEVWLVTAALRGLHSHQEKNQYRVYTIANKLIKEYSNDALSTTFDAEELLLSNDEIKALKNDVRKAYERLKIDTFTLEASPTVGYIQQNKLYSFLNNEEHLDSWAFPHPKSNELQGALLKVAEKLVDCGVYIPSEEYSLNYICLIARKWINGETLKEIIAEQIAWDERRALENGGPRKTVNSSVRRVIKVINNDIRFRLSNAIRCHSLLLSSILTEKKLSIVSVKLHSYIEVGACEPRVISLINIGLTREASIEIDAMLDKNKAVDTMRELQELYRDRALDSVHGITKKELIRLLS